MTPEERREALLSVIRQERFQWLSPEGQYDAILSHFLVNEPYVADAIRYGLTEKVSTSDDGRLRSRRIVITYPEGHER